MTDPSSPNLSPEPAAVLTDAKTGAPLQTTRDWSVEVLHDGFRQAIEISDLLYDNETAHQRIRVFQSKRFGRVLTLDDIVQTTEADEFIYHEMLTHPALLAHGAARRVLIVGGGDGGMLRETLRHPKVEHVTMVEIDAGVVDFSKQYLPSLSNGAFDDPRLELVIADGADFMRTTDQSYDVVIVDSTDPIGPGETLFTDHFYAHAKARLTASGVLVTQNGVPFLQDDELRGTMRAFKTLFTDWSCYIATVPTYVGGPMAFGWGSNDAALRRTPETLLSQRMKAAGLTTRYYTPAVHKAAFALPGYIQEMLP